MVDVGYGLYCGLCNVCFIAFLFVIVGLEESDSSALLGETSVYFI